MKLVVLAGGSGTRLWPLSRKLFPKQFIQLFEDRSLFQKTLTRNKINNISVVTNEQQYFLVIDQAKEDGYENLEFILEPVGRNTAPAIALACFDAKPDEVILVTPSDHIIKKEGEYLKCLQKAEKLAQQGHLVTFGIAPTFPSTGYGYIQADGENVISFKEKPDLFTADKYVKSGNYYWNSGMFVFKAGVFLEELNKFSPDIYKASKKAFENAVTDSSGMLRIKHDDMMAIPANSIDYAVMEKSNKVKVVSADIGWSDLGSYDEIAEYFNDGKSEGKYKEDIAIDSENNFVVSTEGKIVSTAGVSDLVIIDTSDALLIARKGETQKVKQIVDELQKRGSALINEHTTVHRPWGTYTVLLEHNNYKIKRIEVKPKHKLSFQKHEHRNEHWVVVSGEAMVSKEQEKLVLFENQSTYIPKGVRHRLENQGEIPLVIIEAQVGSYVGEDDIIRYEDDYNRK